MRTDLCLNEECNACIIIIVLFTTYTQTAHAYCLEQDFLLNKRTCTTFVNVHKCIQ